MDFNPSPPDNRPILYLDYKDTIEIKEDFESNKRVIHNINLKFFSDRHFYDSIETVQNGELGDQGFAVVVTYTEFGTCTDHYGMVACASVSPTPEMAEAEMALVRSGAHPQRHKWGLFNIHLDPVDIFIVKRFSYESF